MNSDLEALETIALYLDQGYPVDDVFEIILKVYKSPATKKMALGIAQGIPLNEVINQVRLPPVFLEYFYFFDNGINLAQAITTAVKLAREHHNTRMMIIKKSAYPLLLLLFLMAFSIFLIISLIPQINSLFASFSITNSGFSRLVFRFLNWFPYLMVVLGLTLTIFAIVIWSSIRSNYFVIIDFLIKLKLVGPAIKSYYSLKFAIYYNELLKAGYDTTNIITILYDQISDNDLKMLVHELKVEIEKGIAVENVVANFDYFNDYLKSYFYLMIQNNQNDKNLNLYIESQKKLIDNRINLLIKLLQPLTFGFVGFFIISIYLAVVIPMMDVIKII